MRVSPQRNDIEVGDTLVIELASGEFDYELVGLSNDFSRSAYLDRADLAADLGEPGMVQHGLVVRRTTRHRPAGGGSYLDGCRPGG